jgi:hypothetical protein
MKIAVGDRISMNLLGSGSWAMVGYPSTITHTHNLALSLSLHILRYKNNDQRSNSDKPLGGRDGDNRGNEERQAKK